LFEILTENLQILNVERGYTSCIQFGMGLCSEISPFQDEQNKMALSWKILRINSESGSNYLPDDKAAFCVLSGICHRLRNAPQRPEKELEKGAMVIEQSLESNPIFDESDWARLNVEE
jgi:hypothetical protein